jgi:hypothetical protein
MRIKCNSNFVLRRVCGSDYLINITENYLDDKCTFYELNEIGSFIWEHIGEGIEVSVLLHNLISAINDDVDQSIISDDLMEFIGVLKRNGFITEY